MGRRDWKNNVEKVGRVRNKSQVRQDIHEYTLLECIKMNILYGPRLIHFTKSAFACTGGILTHYVLIARKIFVYLERQLFELRELDACKKQNVAVG